MRVLVDTNVLIAYLLKPESDLSPSRIVRAGLEKRFTFIIGSTCIAELERSVRQKSWLSSRIRETALVETVSMLRRHVEIVSSVARAGSQQISRDPDDDVVLLDAAFAEVDYLVTGDADLLTLDRFAAVRIVSPADFLAILEP